MMTTSAIRKVTAAAALAGMLGFGVGVVAAERHPEIARAMHALQNAKRDLEHAAKDFGGHRVAALNYINQAIGELQQARKADTN